MIEHLGLTNHIYHMTTNVFEEDDLAVSVLSTSISFDQSITELFSPLIAGGTQVVIENILYLDTVTSPTMCVATPSAFASLTSWPKSLRAVVLGGESTSMELKNRMYENLTLLRGIWNSFGPTEVTDMCCIPKFERHSEPIAGGPMPNVRIYVVDKNLQALPIGVKGELCVAGVGVARGYMNKADLTQKAFIPNPFEQRGRMYLTGDLVKWREDGQIIYYGRKDSQVKVNGHRIELEEVRSVIMIHGGNKIADCVVKICEVGRSRAIFAYVTPSTVDISDVHRRIKNHLPDFMLPTHILSLDKFEHNNSGKVDLEKLPMPVVKAPVQQNSHDADPICMAVLEAYRDTLGVPTMGYDSDFFEVGGHSLLVLRLIEKIRHCIPGGFEVSQIHVHDAFMHSSPSKMLKYLFGSQFQPETCSLQKCQ